MKALGIPSIRSPQFRMLVNDRFAFHHAITNYIKDENEKLLAIKAITDFISSLFGGGGSRSSDAVAEAKKNLERRLLELSMKTGRLPANAKIGEL